MDKFMKSSYLIMVQMILALQLERNTTQLPRTYIWAFNHLTYPNSHQTKL